MSKRFKKNTRAIYTNFAEGRLFNGVGARILYTSDDMGKSLSVSIPEEQFMVTIPFDEIEKLIRSRSNG